MRVGLKRQRDSDEMEIDKEIVIKLQKRPINDKVMNFIYKKRKEKKKGRISKLSKSQKFSIKVKCSISFVIID